MPTPVTSPPTCRHTPSRHPATSHVSPSLSDMSCPPRPPPPTFHLASSHFRRAMPGHPCTPTAHVTSPRSTCHFPPVRSRPTTHVWSSRSTTTCLTTPPRLSTTCPVPSCRPYATIHSRARRPHPDEPSLLSTARLRRPMSGRVCAAPPDDSGRARSSRITPTCQPRPDMPFRTIPIHIYKGVTQ
jgi:hypothetical protein